jgi:adenylate cyclase
MATPPNKLSQFWQELKRRKVIYVITVYASAAFVIIELVNNVTEPLNLPERMSTIVIVVLAIGFPVAIILSWIFDLTPKGIEKTKSTDEEEHSEIPYVQNRWKIATYVSIVVIMGLIILNLTGGTSNLKAGDIQSLAILPIENFTGDDQFEYFVSGLHFSLIGDIQKIGGLKVKSRTSSNVYDDVDMSVPQIASELDVDAVLEAGVMCLGEDSICIRLSLITSEEEQIWMADFRVERGQVLNLCSRVAETIADEVMVELTPEEKRLFAKDRTVDMEAHDAYLRGLALNRESFYEALEYLNLALEKDPNFAPLYLELANIWLFLRQWGYEPPEIANQKISEYVNKALELDPDHPGAHAMSAGIALEADWNWVKAEQEQLKSLGLNPNDVYNRVFYGHFLLQLQRPDEALVQAKLAVELAPLDPFILALAAVVFHSVGEGKVALGYVDKALSIDPHHSFALNVLEFVAFRNGDYDRAFEASKYFLKDDLEHADKDSIKKIERIFEEQGYFEAYEAFAQYLEILYQYEYFNPFWLANLYCWVNNYEKAMDWLEIGFERQDPNMRYITSGVYTFDSLYTNPRFIAFLEKMNLPIPKTD